MNEYTTFNRVCLCIVAFCLGGMLWLWQGEVLAVVHSAEQTDTADNVAVTSRQEIEKAKIVETVVPSQAVSSSVSLTSSTVQNTSTTTETPDIKPLPPTINLAVPFTSQAPEKNWSQPWQDACEEAAVLMMDAYYKDYKLSPLFAKEEILKIVNWEEVDERKWGRSIEIEKIQDIFDSFLKVPTGKKIKIIENPTTEQIKKYVASGQPVYVVADGKVLPNPHFQNGGPEYHALVIRGYTETQFITNDPGTQFGENFKYKYDDLMKSIRDWNGGDVKSGRRVVLVVE